MPNFCANCGTPLNGGLFCVKCGVDARANLNSEQVQSYMPATETAPTSPRPANPAQIGPAIVPSPAVQTGMSTLAKFAIVAIVIIFVGGVTGAVGMYYVAHRVSQKFHQLSDGVLKASSESGHSTHSSSEEVRASASNDNHIGNVCRLLNKDHVSQAIGVQIVRAAAEDNGCTYIAKGTQAEMTAKHASAMAGDLGVDKKSQQAVETFSAGLGKVFESEKPAPEQDTSGEVPVFSFSIDQNAAETQLQLNAKVLGIIGSQERLPGIGDQAFVSADGMIFMRKGKNLVRILYQSCPCGMEQVKPLAQEIADAL